MALLLIIGHHRDVNISSIKDLQTLFRRHGATEIYAKKLAPRQDNEKNQIYIGSGLVGASNLFPARIVARAASKSTFKPKSSVGRPKLEAQLQFAWLGRDGSLYPAPHARIIDYFQFPEIRFSGFMRGCRNPPDALRRDRQAMYGQRILLLAVSGTDQTIGFVITEAEDPLVGRFPELPTHPALPTFNILSSIGAPNESPTDLLIHELTRIHRAGWHPSVILKPRESSPVPFRGNQGGGFTLEALLGVPANAAMAPDKHGYEIKSFGGGKITLMTPGPDGGYEGSHTFRQFMAKYGRSGRAGDGRTVFTGVHRCDQANAATGYTLSLEGYDSVANEFANDTTDIQITIRDTGTEELVSSWSFDKLANSWNKKHASAVYVKREKRPHKEDDQHDYDYRYLSEILICVGTDIWRLLRAISSGDVYLDPAHTLYPNGMAKVRHQWRMNTSRLERSLRRLYESVRVVSL